MDKTTNGYCYYRKQVRNSDGTRTSVYGRTQAELAANVKAHCQKVEAAQRKSEGR